MNELELKYDCNPNQKPPRIFIRGDRSLPIQVLCGRPEYISFMDAFNGWQLVRELKAAAGLPAAASFKHVSPAGAAVGLPLDETLTEIYWADDMGGLSPLACTYVRARRANRMSSFGGFIALSDVCDVDTARIIKREVSDGMIAPGYEPEALEILKAKKDDNYSVIQMDETYMPEEIEHKRMFGIAFEQGRDESRVDEELLSSVVTANRDIPESAIGDLCISLTTLKYTQPDSMCYVKDGQAIDIGTGQQSKVCCTRLAGNEADNWYLRQVPQVLGFQFVDGIRRADRDNTIDAHIGEDYIGALADGVWENTFKAKPPISTKEEKRTWLDGMIGVALGSDAFLPFGDNIDRAFRSGMKYMAQPGGPVRDDNMIATCDKYGMAMVFIGIRLLHRQVVCGTSVVLLRFTVVKKI